MNILKRYYLTISITILISGLFIISGAVPETLIFNHDSITNGEYWRLVSAHLVHSDREHLIWNLCAFILLSLLLEQQNRMMILIALAAGIFMIDFYLWFNTIGVINYAGFSGALNTLLVVTLFQQRQHKQHSKELLLRLLPVTIYIACLLKIIIEITSQQAIFSHISWQALPQVHLVGFITGTMIIIFSYKHKEILNILNQKMGITVHFKQSESRFRLKSDVH